jgi:hypothetical protein
MAKARQCSAGHAARSNLADVGLNWLGVHTQHTSCDLPATSRQCPPERPLFELSDDLDDAVNVAIELCKILSGNPILGVNRSSNFLNAIAA